MVDKFEAKKDAMRQVQSGDWKVTFTVQPGDMPDWFLKAEMGKHVVIGIVEVADDGQPVDQERKAKARALGQARYQEADAGPAAVIRAAMLANDIDFQAWVANRWSGGPAALYERAVQHIRDCCGVQSRSEIATDAEALRLFHKLENEFRDHQRYGDVA